MRAANAASRGFRRIGYLDLPGGGQVVVDGDYAYVGHMAPPLGTSIIDVSDPSAPAVVAQVDVPPDIHSHKVRVTGDVMLVNYERFPSNDASHARRVGLKVFDIADRRRPREIGFLPTHGRGVHRFDLQGTRAFVSTGWPGFRSNLLAIVDIAKPAAPTLLGRWWFEGLEEGGGDRTPSDFWVHLALARGNRAYVACGVAGAAIVDITDPRRPATVSRINWHPPYGPPTHTFLPVPHAIRNRRFAVATDEDVTDDVLEDPPAFMWIFDITNEAQPVPVATYHADPEDLVRPGKRFGAHQPWEHVGADNIVFVTWFSGGLRAVDISDPYRPREAGRYVPTGAPPAGVAQSNDVFVDHRGLVYLIDRYRGLTVLEFTPHGWNRGRSRGRNGGTPAAGPRARRTVRGRPRRTVRERPRRTVRGRPRRRSGGAPGASRRRRAARGRSRR